MTEKSGFKTYRGTAGPETGTLDWRSEGSGERIIQEDKSGRKKIRYI